MMPFVSAGTDGLDRSPIKNRLYEVFIKSLKNSVILSTSTSELSHEKNSASIELQFHRKIRREIIYR